jgi:hypothetical protein
VTEEIFQTVLLGNGIVYIKPNKNIAIEQGIAKDIVASFKRDTNSNIERIGLIINMSRVAFITEEAGKVLCCETEPGISHLALVSDNHLSNVVATLTFQHCGNSSIEKRLFKSAADAVDWLQNDMVHTPSLDEAC